MFAYEKFDVFDEIISTVPSDRVLTYSPLFREAFHFCLQGVDRKGTPTFNGGLTLSGVDKKKYPEKKEIKKIGYFYDEKFLKNVLEGFVGKGVEVKKLGLLPANSKRILSNKQKEEIDFFDSMLKGYFCADIRHDIENRFYLVNGMVAKYYDLLKKSGVDALIFRVYYGLNYFPIIFACKMLGITVIDVQHGINGFRHTCYSRFKSNEINSPLLPDVFWTWSDMATHMLKKDSSIECGAAVIEGGNPVFSTWQESRGKKILYTHQPQSKGIPIPINEIKRVYEIKQREVVVRPHPLHIDEAESVISLLQKEKIRARLEDSRKIPINESLMQTSIHVTCFSTCALDALNFGIPSVHCSDLIGDVEDEFSTGLLFRADEITRENMVRDREKSIDYSLGSEEKVESAVAQILLQTAN